MASLLFSSMTIALIVIAVSHYSFAANSLQICQRLLGEHYELGSNKGLVNFKRNFYTRTIANTINKFKKEKMLRQLKSELILDYSKVLFEDNGIELKDQHEWQFFCNEAAKKLIKYLKQKLTLTKLISTCKNYIKYLNIKTYEGLNEKERAFRTLYDHWSLSMLYEDKLFKNEKDAITVNDKRDRTFYMNNFLLVFVNQFTALVFHLSDDTPGILFESVEQYCNTYGFIIVNQHYLNGKTEKVNAFQDFPDLVLGDHSATTKFFNTRKIKTNVQEEKKVNIKICLGILSFYYEKGEIGSFANFEKHFVSETQKRIIEKFTLAQNLKDTNYGKCHRELNIALLLDVYKVLHGYKSNLKDEQDRISFCNAASKNISKYVKDNKLQMILLDTELKNNCIIFAEYLYLENYPDLDDRHNNFVSLHTDLSYSLKKNFSDYEKFTSDFKLALIIDFFNGLNENVGIRCKDILDKYYNKAEPKIKEMFNPVLEEDREDELTKILKQNLVLDYYKEMVEDNGILLDDLKTQSEFCSLATYNLIHYLKRKEEEPSKGKKPNKENEPKKKAEKIWNETKLISICLRYVGYLNLRTENKREAFESFYELWALDMLHTSEFTYMENENEEEKTFFTNNFLLPFANQFTATVFGQLDDIEVDSFHTLASYCEEIGYNVVHNVKLLEIEKK